MTTRAVNIHVEGCDVYIGRGSGSHLNNTKIGQRGWLGNPYPLSEYTRDESIGLFRRDFEARIANDEEFKAAVEKLAGKRLGCFCKPAACHGDVIAEYLNGLK